MCESREHLEEVIKANEGQQPQPQTAIDTIKTHSFSFICGECAEKFFNNKAKYEYNKHDEKNLVCECCFQKESKIVVGKAGE